MTTQPWANRTVKPRRGYVYKADGAFVTITRVARDGSWADIVVEQMAGANWSKRQPLVDGLLPFPAVIWSTE